MRRFAIAGALLVVALATSALHRDEPWTPRRIGEHWVLEGDVHVHSSWAGALSTPIDLPLLAARRQLDFIAVTEHNAWLGGGMTRSFARSLAPGVIVLPSEEITNRAYHLLAIGLDHRVDPTLPLSAIADDVHAQGGVVVAAHPTRGTWPLLLGLAEAGKLDGAEVFHPTTLRRGGPRAAEYAAFLEEASRRAGKPLVAFGSSDFHGGSKLGVCRTVVLARERSTAGILEAIKAGRVVAITSDGQRAGDPRWIEELAAARYAPRADRNADSLGARLGLGERLLAWAVLVVMLLALARPRDV